MNLTYGYFATTHSHTLASDDFTDYVMTRDTPTVQGVFGWIEAAPSAAQLETSAEDQEASCVVVSRSAVEKALGRELLNDLAAKSRTYYAPQEHDQGRTNTRDSAPKRDVGAGR